MNKTIHELNSLSQAEVTDELIIYDVSEGESKKIQVQNLNNPNYSTTEQKTGGTWIDGKPIYRKVIDGLNAPSTTSWTTVISTGLENVDTMVKIYGIMVTSDNYQIVLPWAEQGYTIVHRFYNTNKSVLIKLNATNFYNFPYTLILEYTKTTD